MFNKTKISTALLGIVGFRQPNNPEYAIIDEANLASSSGYFVNDDPNAKVEFIKDNQDHLEQTDEEFNDKLREMQQASIANVCNQVFSDFDFIDNNLLFKNASNKVDLEELPQGFIGYRIKVSKDRNIAFKINRVLCDFDGTGQFELLLWNTAKKAVLESKVITITSDHEEVVLDWEVDNSGGTYKGDYYIGYINDLLDIDPFKRVYENASVMTEFKDLCITKVYVPNHFTNSLFDLRLIQGLSEDTGLNLDITVYEDFTNLVINNKGLFAKAICTDMIIQCMKVYLCSIRTNRNQIISEQLFEKVIAELEGTNPDSVIRVKGMKAQLIGEISSIRKEIQKLKKGFFKSGQLLSTTLQ